MSIEWLLTKTKGAEAKGKLSERPHEEGTLSDKECSSNAMEKNERKESSDGERLHRNEYSLSAEMQNPQSETNLQCSCGYTGSVNQSKTDFKLLQIDKDGLAYFECPRCEQHLRYNFSTDTTKIKKGFLGFLFGKLR